MKAPSRFNWTVVGCLALIVFIYSTVVSCVIIPWLSYSVPGIFNFGLLTLDTSVAIGCYIACVLADPGRIPDDYIPDEEDTQTILEVKKKGGSLRFCQKCKRYKPPRSHHCRVCKRCVLRMCHHCPWINNCVGHGNYKAFLLFLLYVNAAIFHAFGLLVAHAMQVMALHSEKRAHSVKAGPLLGTSLKATVFWAALQTLCTAVSLPLAIGLAMLLLWNGYLVYSNKTTIEHYEGVTARVLASRAGQTWNHPYDLGLCTNLAAICGPKPQLWLFPVQVSADGDGIGHPTAWGDGSHAGLPSRDGSSQNLMNW